jgi:hypothetical protein
MAPPIDQSCDACWVFESPCPRHDELLRPAEPSIPTEDAVDVAENSIRVDRLIEHAEVLQRKLAVAELRNTELAAERDAYRKQATKLATALCEAGHSDVVDQALAETN